MIDSHCHIDFSDFDADRHTVWQRSKSQGLTGLVIPGVAEAQWEQAKSLCLANSEFRFAVGVHPWWLAEHFSAITADAWPRRISELEDDLYAAAQHPLCVAIGECGLDALKLPIELGVDSDVAQTLQSTVLRAHINVANKRDLPLIVHSVKAHSETLSILQQNPVSAGGVIHGFNGSAELANSYWEKRFRIGVGGSITYVRASKTRRAVQSLPRDALLLESDAPSMPISGKQGQRNSPEYLNIIADCLAELRNEHREDVVQYTTDNTLKLFSRFLV